MTPRFAAILVAAALGILALSGCDALPGRPRPTDRAAVPSQATTFSALYSQHCAGCHGANGHLGAARPLNDPLYLALIPQDRLRQIVAQGVPGTAMPAFAANAGGVLTEAQIEALVSGMLVRWTQPSAFTDVSLPPYDAVEAIANGSGTGDPERGWMVYATACAGCHGADGNGGPNGGSVVNAAYLTLVSDQALRTAVIAGRTDLGMPDWRQDTSGQALTPQEITDVVAWLISQRRPAVGRTTSSAEAKRPQP
jgi:cytochrome c oxidase cbb3-type subunit 3